MKSMVGCKGSVCSPHRSFVLNKGWEEKRVCHLDQFSGDVCFTGKVLFLGSRVEN